MSINLWTSYLSLNINHKPVKYLTDLSNIFNINKLVAIIFVLNMFSLAGIPPLAGFFSKLLSVTKFAKKFEFINIYGEFPTSTNFFQP